LRPSQDRHDAVALLKLTATKAGLAAAKARGINLGNSKLTVAN
jgi:hypothetical protein